MKILVTGGAGFIGSHLVHFLLEQNHIVHIVDNLSTGSELNLRELKGKFKFINRDVCQKFTETHPYDVIYHLAALARIQPSFENPLETYRTNSLGTINVLEYARQVGAKVVYAGSSCSYHDIYANPYAYSKWLGEQHCILYSKIYGVSTSIARFFNVYGPRQIREGAYATVIGIFERQMLSGEPLTVTGDGEQRRDFTHVNDIVSGLHALGQHSFYGDVFNLGTGKNYSINEVAAMFKGKVKYLPRPRGEAPVTLADITKTLELGWKPEHDLEKYVADFAKSAQWFLREL